MKTRELIDKVFAFGIKVILRDDGRLELIDVYKNTIVAVVNTRKIYQFSNDYLGWEDLSTETKRELFSIIKEYVETPGDKREEEKKFYLRHRWIRWDSGTLKYLNRYYKSSGNAIYFLDNEEIDGDVQTQFTQKEIGAIKTEFNTMLKDFEQIEVEDE